MDLCKMTVSQLREMLLARKISASELLSVHLERIERSHLNAYITLNDKAMEAAREIDLRISSGQELPPLAGIPIAVKDNISTKGLRTTCASKMLENYSQPVLSSSVRLIWTSLEWALPQRILHSDQSEIQEIRHALPAAHQEDLLLRSAPEKLSSLSELTREDLFVSLLQCAELLG